MSNILLAQAFEGQEVRVAGTPDEPLFVGADVVGVLYPEAAAKDRPTYLRSVPEKWKGLHEMQTLGGTQKLAVLTEPGLYWLIARSNSPRAVPFQDWLFSEVLPAIRKTGQYQSGSAFATPRNFLSHYKNPWENFETPEEMIKRFEWVVKRVGVRGCFDYGYGKAILNDIIDAHHLTLPIPYADEIYRREVKPANHEYQVLKLLLCFLGLRFEEGRLVGFDDRSAPFPSEKMPRYLAVKTGVVEDFCDGYHSFASCLRLTAVHNNALVDVISGAPEKCWFFDLGDLEKAFRTPFDPSDLPSGLNPARYGLQRIDGRLRLPASAPFSIDVLTLFRSCLNQLGVSLDDAGNIQIDPMHVRAGLRQPVIHRTRDGKVYLAVESPSLVRACGNAAPGPIISLAANHRGTARFPDGKGSTSPSRCRWFDPETIRAALS